MKSMWSPLMAIGGGWGGEGGAHDPSAPLDQLLLYGIAFQGWDLIALVNFQCHN